MTFESPFSAMNFLEIFPVLPVSDIQTCYSAFLARINQSGQYAKYVGLKQSNKVQGGRCMMKTILCYGDSNTWGYRPDTQTRYSRDERWPGVFRNALGEDYLVIEEGLNGRTTVWDDPIEGYKNGKEYLIPCLETHKPLDLVIIMLGTNDLKKRFSLGAFDIAGGAGVLVKIVQKSETGIDGNPPKVLVMAPPPIAKLTDFAAMFEGAKPKSDLFSQEYARMAQETGCEFLDTADTIVSSDVDGIHFDVGEHQKLGLAVAARVRELI
jgi:lysophospholipase L1-like esterase